VPRLRLITHLAAAVVASVPTPRPGPPRPPALGLALESVVRPAAQDRVLEELRRTGVSLFALTVSWSEVEPSRGVYHVDEVIRAARVLRQSGAVLHLDLPLVTGRTRDVARDLTGVAFDDPRLSLRLGRLLDALRPALLDCSTLSLGSEADTYFADKPEELKAYRRLFDGAVEYLSRVAPALRVGVATAAPTESVAPSVAAALHQRSPVLFFAYAPFVPNQPFVHRPPADLDADWKALLERARPRPVAFVEVSYSSAAENGSSPEQQAEFVRRMRRFLASADGTRLLFARYAVWRDPPESAPSPAATEILRRRDSFFAHRGLQSAEGRPKPAWTAWLAGR
jgi:hypothetical protein